jgi:hypothetical protein
VRSTIIKIIVKTSAIFERSGKAHTPWWNRIDRSHREHFVNIATVFAAARVAGAIARAGPGWRGN